jgi:hypothetical protein
MRESEGGGGDAREIEHHLGSLALRKLNMVPEVPPCLTQTAHFTKLKELKVKTADSMPTLASELKET